MNKVIDPHIHLFDLDKGDYLWLRPEQPPHWSDKHQIYRNFSEVDLSLGEKQAFAGFVHIEAGFDNRSPWKEVKWLESTVTLPFRSVACVDLTQNENDFEVAVEKLKTFSSVVGVRHILDEQAAILLTDQRVQNNLSTLAHNDLLFEAQFFGKETQAADALASLLERFKDLKVVINHAAFPTPIDMGIWRSNLSVLSECSNVFVKASGWEMTDRKYSLKHMQEVIGHLITLFGENRVMLASNFPLCLFSKKYQTLWECYTKLPFSEACLQKLTHDNAHKIYAF
ncbi:amidohydrolase [Veronia nyctiphanis]|uniref:Amidohydrolase n=1 Tax=Veronia nyctiphanis TaxID=1278244 RepID=A0A4Q0YSA3_9GAMM|nr:amidohydrolase family protein [Veronia nyctiphanis]RXJ73555.1 amidohydrolase [Veronia nyctiphanis]